MACEHRCFDCPRPDCDDDDISIEELRECDRRDRLILIARAAAENRYKRPKYSWLDRVSEEKREEYKKKHYARSRKWRAEHPGYDRNRYHTDPVYRAKKLEQARLQYQRRKRLKEEKKEKRKKCQGVSTPSIGPSGSPSSC